MHLLKLSSVTGFTARFAGMNTNVTNNAGAITTINGDAAAPGSIANSMATSDTYIDNLVANIDLSQMALNQSAIATLNGTVDAAGSVLNTVKVVEDAKLVEADQVVSDLDAIIDVTTASITTLNGTSTTVGSVSNYVAQVVGDSPVEMNELNEVIDAINAQTSVASTILNVITTNDTITRAAVDGLLVDTEGRAAVYDTALAAEVQLAKLAIDAKYVAYRTFTDGKYLSRSANLSDVASIPTAVTELGALNANGVANTYANNRNEYKLETKTVTAGVIPSLDARVAEEHMESVLRVYPEGDFDEAVVDYAAGIFTVRDTTAGDLDGLNVEVKYVIDQAL